MVKKVKQVKTGPVNAEAPSRSRPIRLSPEQTDILKTALAELNELPSEEVLDNLSTQTSLTAKWIKGWYYRQRTNKRKKIKKKSSRTVSIRTLKIEAQDPAIPGDAETQDAALPSSSPYPIHLCQTPSRNEKSPTRHSSSVITDRTDIFSTPPRLPCYDDFQDYFSAFPSLQKTPGTPRTVLDASYLTNFHYPQRDAVSPLGHLTLPSYDSGLFLPASTGVFTEDAWNPPSNEAFAFETDLQTLLSYPSSPPPLGSDERSWQTDNTPNSVRDPFPLLEDAILAELDSKPPQTPHFSQPLGIFEQPPVSNRTNTSLNDHVTYFSKDLQDDRLPQSADNTQPLGPSTISEPITTDALDVAQFAYEGNALEVALRSLDTNSAHHNPFQAAVGLVLLSRLGFTWDQDPFC